MPREPEKVELHQAWSWDCPECGRENFERAVTCELSDEDKQHMKEDHGIPDPMTGDWVSAPLDVTCKHCGKDFETEEPDDDEDD